MHDARTKIVKATDALGFSSLIVAASALLAAEALPISDGLALSVFTRAFEFAAIALLAGRVMQITQRLQTAPRTSIAARAAASVTRLTPQTAPNVARSATDRKAA